MAKMTTEVANRQSGKTEFPGKDPSTRKKFVLLDKGNNVVATLIDRTLAEKWLSDNKKGAVKFIEKEFSLKG